MRVLVTGGTGFVGAHLARILGERGHERSLTSEAADPRDRGVFPLTLPDEGRSLEVIRESRPDAIVHLAGVSFVPDAEKSPSEAFAVNVEGTQALLRALNRSDPDGRVRFVFASTGQVYGTTTGEDGGDVQFSEESPLRPQNVYARTKLAAELAIDVLSSAARRPTVIFRSFNHVGPGQRDAFAVSCFARQVARIERGRSPPVLETGSLAVRRDFCDVRDVAAAYALAAEGAVAAGIYNLASGKATALEAVVSMLRGYTRTPFEVRVREDRLRGAEAPALRGDASKMRITCGWEPRVPLEASVLDVLNWWRERSDA